MHATNDRDQFAPPRPPGRMRAIALAVLAHAALIGALTWGVNWKSSSDQPAVEAELWSAVPQQAAPRAVEPGADTLGHNRRNADNPQCRNTVFNAIKSN